MNLDHHLNDKANHNGAFPDTAEYAQGLKFMLRRGPNWDALPSESKEALENIATCVARLLHGDHVRASHWNKIAGWARLRGAQLEELEEDIAHVVHEPPALDSEGRLADLTQFKVFHPHPGNAG